MEYNRKQGNEYFKKRNYSKAKEFYDKAIELNPNDGALYSNRALTDIKLENFGDAISDSNQSIRLNFYKGYYRRGTAHLGLGKFTKAIKDFKLASKYFPKNADIIKKLNFCVVEVRKLIFAESIKNSLTVPIYERVDIEKLVVEKDYTGLNLDFPLKFSDFEKIKTEFKNEELLHKRYVWQIVLETLKILKKEQNIVKSHIEKNSKFNICGDIHGQYYDLMEIFRVCGSPSQKNIYLFNGDFVDRGSFSVECVVLLFALKVMYPDHFYLNRGNHETESMNKIYGFKNEVMAKYDEDMYELFAETFRHLPLGHVLGDKILIIHGGLSADCSVTLDQMQKVRRFVEPPEKGLMCDTLWSDPSDTAGITPSKRGAGVQFGKDILDNFLRVNKLKTLIRSHEVKQNGYEIKHDGKLITVFSAPNYCDTVGNKGAVIVCDEEYNLSPVTFRNVPHPDVKSMKYAMNLG